MNQNLSPTPVSRFFLRLILLSSVLLSAAANADENGVMMQYFHWYTPSRGDQNSSSIYPGLWREVTHSASELSKRGFTAIWLPPATKGAGGLRDVGYGVYDRYDLGEFRQKGTVSTKYGTREEYEIAIGAAHRAGLKVYADVVLNHMVGEDAVEPAPVVEVYRQNRTAEIPGSERSIAAPTVFNFAGRNGAYSAFKWDWSDFTAVDWDANARRSSIYKFRGSYGGFQDEVDSEFGNYDYLLGADLNMRNPAVTRELKNWGNWYAQTFQLDGFRLDAVKHMPFTFISEWLTGIRSAARKTRSTPFFAVGEYWSYDVRKLLHYLDVTGGKLSLFDAPLHNRFNIAGSQNGFFDMRELLDGTLVRIDPNHAVTFVENHDTQSLQSLESPVADWFKPLAYAVILLRAEGYPCVFYADYFGATYSDHGRTIRMPRFSQILDPMLFVRRKFGYGRQRDYFDDEDVVGWTRSGNARHPGGMAVLLNDNRVSSGEKRMCLGIPYRGTQIGYKDYSGGFPDRVTLGADGCATFKALPGSVSIWAPEERPSSFYQ